MSCLIPEFLRTRLNLLQENTESESDLVWKKENFELRRSRNTARTALQCNAENKSYKNLAIANRSRVSCAHNTLKASIGIHYTVTLKYR